MAELQPAHFTQGACHTAQGDRQTFSSIVCEQGVQDRVGGDLVVTEASAPLQIDVAAGSAFIDGTTVSEQGMYHVFNDSTVTLPISGGDPTDTRWDAVIARVYDSQYAGALDEWRLEVVEGTPSPSPVLPTLPDNSLLLARVSVRVGANDNGDIAVHDERVAYQLCRQNVPDYGFAEQIIYEGNSEFRIADYPLARYLRVRVIGGGGAGGGSQQTASTPENQFSCGSGGGSGAYSEAFLDAQSLPSAVEVVVGSGGNGNLGAGGGSGEGSRFGTDSQSYPFVYAWPGSGGGLLEEGINPAVELGGDGANGSGSGDFLSGGSAGQPAIRMNGQSGVSGTGAAGPYGGGGRGITHAPGQGDAGNPGLSPGAGGGGASSKGTENGHTGGHGAPGIVVVEVYN